jgi:hypothetical protein
MRDICFSKLHVKNPGITVHVRYIENANAIYVINWLSVISSAQLSIYWPENHIPPPPP